MSISEIEAIFKRDLNTASPAGQSLYRSCRRRIQRARRREDRVVHAGTHSYKVAHEAAVLLTHPRNRFYAYVKVDPRRGGFSIIIDLRARP